MPARTTRISGCAERRCVLKSDVEPVYFRGRDAAADPASVAKVIPLRLNELARFRALEVDALDFLVNPLSAPVYDSRSGV